jgi:phosphoesterase RecJ-like protein
LNLVLLKWIHSDMALNEISQIKTLLSEKRHILIACPQVSDGDTIGSALALALWLKKHDKIVDIVIDNSQLPSVYKFLQGSNLIKSQLPPLQKFVLTVDVHDTGMEALTYDIQNEKVRIFITPKQGAIGRDKVRTAQSDFLYDLIFTVSATDFEVLGSVYANNTELFFRSPVINIDHHVENERFGQVNFLDTTATTTAEVAYSLLSSLGHEYIDADTASALLAGIIAKTRSFKSDTTRPRLLTLASTLIELGANRDAIVTQLFRTRTVATLKLWGQTLNHLQEDKALGLVWSSLTREDFIRSGAAENDLSDVIDELISNARTAKIILLFHEHVDKSGMIHVIAKGNNGTNIKELFTAYRPQGEKNVISFTVDKKSLTEAENEIVDFVRRIKL